MNNPISLISGLLQSKPLIDEGSASWIADTFRWALENFDSEEFYKRSQLIQPNNHFFPGKVDSVHALAENIFMHTLNYSGFSSWPFKVQPPELFEGLPPPRLSLGDTEESIERNSEALSAPIAESETLLVSYQPQQTGKPEDLSSNFAHLIAQHVIVQTQKFPPGGPDFFAAGTEVIGIFMGFGVMFANSAFTYRGGCGSCYNAQANRQSTLSEEEATFALALYCHLKQIPYGEATRFLKKHLKGSYKRAVKQIQAMPPINTQPTKKLN